MRHGRVTQGIVLAVALLLATAVPAGAAPPDDQRSEHDRIVAFWTHERVARAKPRDFILDPSSGRFVPGEHAKPGTGGGGGGSGTTAGSSWTGVDTLVDATTGKVLFAMGGSYYVCSASVATNPAGLSAPTSVILTAAHCAYDEVAKLFATNWVFIPDYDHSPAPLSTSTAAYCPDTRYGCWTASRLVVHNGYASQPGFTKAALLYDFAFAVVGPGGKGTTDLDGALGAQAISFDTTPSSAHAFGYPASGKYRGKDLVFCNGPLGTDTVGGNDTYSMTCGMTGGSSGGPWLSPFTGGSGTLVSVNSYGYSGVNKMFGPKFNENTAALHAATTSGSGDTIIG